MANDCQGVLFPFYPTNIMSSACFYVYQLFLPRLSLLCKESPRNPESSVGLREFHGCNLENGAVLGAQGRSFPRLNHSK
jgi:hypothetical protein